MTRCLTVLALLVLSGCDKVQALLPKSPQTLKSSDGTLQITVPGSWSDDNAPDRKMNDLAVLQASNRGSDLYVVVLTQPKEEKMDLARFSELTRGSQMRAMKNAAEEGPKERKVNGLPAIAYVLRGASDGVDIVLEHVSIDGTKNHHQIVVWTLKSSWDSEKAGLDKIVDSFREVSPGK